MKKRKESSAGGSPVGIGALSVMTILLVVTLSVFAMLTLASARADLALSRRAAETVSAYYAADLQGSSLLEQFSQGSGERLSESIPIDDYRSLFIDAERLADGTVRINAWKTVTHQDDQGIEEDHLPVWDGEMPQ